MQDALEVWSEMLHVVILIIGDRCCSLQGKSLRVEDPKKVVEYVIKVFHWEDAIFKQLLLEWVSILGSKALHDVRLLEPNALVHVLAWDSALILGTLWRLIEGNVSQIKYWRSSHLKIFATFQPTTLWMARDHCNCHLERCLTLND